MSNSQLNSLWLLTVSCMADLSSIRSTLSSGSVVEITLFTPFICLGGGRGGHRPQSMLSFSQRDCLRNGPVACDLSQDDSPQAFHHKCEWNSLFPLGLINWQAMSQGLPSCILHEGELPWRKKESGRESYGISWIPEYRYSRGHIYA